MLHGFQDQGPSSQAGSERLCLGPARRQSWSRSPPFAGRGDRPAVPLGTFSAAGRPGLRHRLCSASSRGSVEPPWAQAPQGLLPWAWGSHRLGSLHGGREGGWWGSVGRDTDQQRGGCPSRLRMALPVLLA
ncbi:unnamed protein product [Rangifer tarandus platyrhynchus]|uniref:Uncharacterized protein n=1 Tax=Rangifer tarandus platyrhynchus TaxID=3082113 RepID=A0ABN8YW18_RANTA|nr:unnamed protein product [Rangifer tarandus platyrhynchus]